ncbi:LppU/SCO3897 family protein [Streptomyces albidoflavus]
MPQGFPQQGPYAAPGMPGAAPEPPAKNKKNILRIVGAVIALAVIGGGWWASQDDAKAAAVGDCMHRGSDDDNNPDLEVVECGSDQAEYKVLAKIEGKFTGMIAQSKCEAEAEGFKYAYTRRGAARALCSAWTTPDPRSGTAPPAEAVSRETSQAGGKGHHRLTPA